MSIERIITDADIVALKAKLGPDIDAWFEGLPVVEQGPGPEPEQPATWSSGAFTENQAATLAAMGAWRGKAMQNAAVFPTYDKGTAELENPWWLRAAGDAPAISLGVPMCLKGGSISTDLSPSFRKMAAAMKADGRVFYLRLGWEMNIGQPWKVTDTNLATWRAAWTRYYDLFKGALGAKGLVGFNPNIGENQSGLSGSILRAWVDGKVDWAGPDIYDCWPPAVNDANVSAHLTRNQGLEWWASTATAKGVPLAIPEWGVSSGTQWPAAQIGRDNPRFIQVMCDYFDRHAKLLMFESYFNERQTYVASDIFRTSGTPVNPLAAARYRELFGSK